MPDARLTLLSTIRSFPDAPRADIERDLAPLARSAALGDLAADVAHDIANPLFGVLGLVDLMLEDVVHGTDAEDRLQFVRQAALEMKATLSSLLDFARPLAQEPARADLCTAARAALGLVRHGAGKLLSIDERYPSEPQVVACAEPLLVQAVLHLLLAACAGARAEKLTLEVTGATVTVSPGGSETFGTLAAARIAADHGGTVDLSDDAITLRLPPV